VTGDVKGQVKFYDGQLQLLACYSHPKVGPIRSISFSKTPPDPPGASPACSTSRIASSQPFVTRRVPLSKPRSSPPSALQLESRGDGQLKAAAWASALAGAGFNPLPRLLGRTGMQDRDAGQGCRTGVQDRDAGQGCRTGREHATLYPFSTDFQFGYLSHLPTRDKQGGVS